MTSATTIFDHLNARYVSPNKVAETFIAPSQFAGLAQPGNTLLVGARGTGKTTLLKMLRLPAFERWRSPEKEAHAPHLTYVSAFIPNDRNWSARINDFALQFESRELQRYARTALVSNQTLRAVIRSASELFNTDFREFEFLKPIKELDRLSAEIRFSQRLCKAVFDRTDLHSISDLEFELGRRIDQLIEDVNAMRTLGESESSVAGRHRWIFSEFLAATERAIDIFQDITGLRDLRWSLCYDELELSHADSRNLLFGYLRGSNPNLYFKLATVPYQEDLEAFQTRGAATVRHDFRVIELWNVQKDQSDRFMQELADSTLLHRGYSETKLRDMLWEPPGTEKEDTAENAFPSSNPRFFESFLSLSDTDPSFRSYLSERGIGVHDFYRMTEDRRAALFRKVQNIVLVRSAFLPRDRRQVPNDGVRGDNRKRPLLRRRRTKGRVYAGAQNLIDICDNNPRFLLAVLDPLISVHAKGRGKVSAESQLEAVSEVSNQVSSVLRGEAVYPKYGGLGSVEDLVKRLGEFFRDQVHAGDFNADPVLSFSMPPEAPASLVKAVGFGIREGAFLLEGAYTGSYLVDGLAHKRIRLSYLFAPRFLLPLMLGREVRLEGILRGKQGRRLPVKRWERDLFGEGL